MDMTNGFRKNEICAIVLFDFVSNASMRGGVRTASASLEITTSIRELRAAIFEVFLPATP
jgi:hypothetical protein